MINHPDFSKDLIMKKQTLTLFFLVSFFVSWSQKPSEKKANELFANRAYVEAAKMYESLQPSKNILQNLADSYYFNSEMKFASKHYAQLYFTYKDSLKPEYLFRYAHALKGIGDYEKADVIMSSYLNYNVNTQKFKEHLVNIIPFNYECKSMQKNGLGDFGISIFGDKVVFASTRNTKSKIYKWNEKPYLDLFQAQVTKEGNLENIVPFSDKINSPTHESSATFSSDGKIMYFSRTNSKMVEVGNEKFASVKIYKAEWVDSKWDNVTELPFSSDEFSCQHPVLSPDNKRLFFSSDRPGSLGSFDIYYVDVHDDGTYSEPINLGETINTKHREQFPFVDVDETLYFSSDGHQGLGGLDVFMSKLYNNVYAKPLNLGETLNSGMDDFAFVVVPNENIGYFSSNRKGQDNLYTFTRKENERKFAVEGEVRDKNTKQLLPGTTVTLYDMNDKLVGQLIVGENADYIFNSEPNTKYKMVAERDFYDSKTEYFETTDDGRVRFVIELEIESYDDAEEIIVTKPDGLVYIQLENIYFDLNKWDIKEEAARTLDVLVAIMKKYPRMEIELGAHTDSRASDAYNLRLSNDRAGAALEYLVSKGINRNRMRSKGYGERVPLIKCGDSCTEVEHSINRRCEFIILK